MIFAVPEMGGEKTQSKLKGVLFTGLINNTNDIIDNANTKKANTKIH